MVDGGEAASFFSSFYGEYFSFLPDQGALALTVLLFAIALVIVAIFIWNFYRSTSKRNLIDLNLRKYNHSEHPLMYKVFATVLYLLEYIVIMPFLITLWYAGLAFVLLLIAKERPINDILLISAAMIAAIRILAYYRTEIAKDLAKLFPFITLSVFLLTPGEFNLEQIVSHIYKIPISLNILFYFILVVAVVEIILRFVYTMFEFWRSEEEATGGVISKDEEDEE
ncbi:MAG: hypothetical protein ABIG28_02130 [archaeon]